MRCSLAAGKRKLPAADATDPMGDEGKPSKPVSKPADAAALPASTSHPRPADAAREDSEHASAAGAAAGSAHTSPTDVCVIAALFHAGAHASTACRWGTDWARGQRGWLRQHGQRRSAWGFPERGQECRWSVGAGSAGGPAAAGPCRRWQGSVSCLLEPGGACSAIRALHPSLQHAAVTGGAMRSQFWHLA